MPIHNSLSLLPMTDTFFRKEKPYLKQSKQKKSLKHVWQEYFKLLESIKSIFMYQLEKHYKDLCQHNLSILGSLKASVLSSMFNNM